MVKPLKTVIFGSNFSKKGSVWALPKVKTNLLAEITKRDRKYSKTFYLKNFTESGSFFYFVYFFAKKGHSSQSSGGYVFHLFIQSFPLEIPPYLPN